MIELGADYIEQIETVVTSADVMLLVIGPGWVGAADERGRRRLDDPDDFVRLEVASALRAHVRVIPLLVRGAEMPVEEELPSALAALAHHDALAISDLDWEAGVARLFELLDKPGKGGSQPSRTPR